MSHISPDCLHKATRSYRFHPPLQPTTERLKTHGQAGRHVEHWLPRLHPLERKSPLPPKKRGKDVPSDSSGRLSVFGRGGLAKHYKRRQGVMSVLLGKRKNAACVVSRMIMLRSILIYLFLTFLACVVCVCVFFLFCCVCPFVFNVAQPSVRYALYDIPVPVGFGRLQCNDAVVFSFLRLFSLHHCGAGSTRSHGEGVNVAPQS